ncbi:MAG: hypothetical protein HQM08_20900 [Candidatus Riflebacteria bacterium]|nr:hypothetical protein [Candidatus Riflebacteria bacterium]
MYDFYLGSRAEIFQDEEKFLLSVKRMLPRWLNSIPDSEYLALHQLLNSFDHSKPLNLAETGTGSSTIVLLYHAMKSKGILFSWDIANPKGAELRSIINDSLCTLFEEPLWKFWKFVASSSTSPYLGIPILKEQNLSIDLCFCDSDHTWETLGTELDLLSGVLKNGAIVTIDDANYRFKRHNTAFINMFRKKLGLDPISSIDDNQCRTFGEEAESLLCSKFKTVESLNTSYSTSCRKDLFFSYYSNDREQMAKEGMELFSELENRFLAWKIHR